MAELIGSTYEVLEQIGSGGGGVVYLANHVRLNKKVVLKADKRKITTRPELLRREVDILKDLSHPYIPKVYDFFVEDEKVYTAIDYIDGESLDKALEREKRFDQPQVIHWAIQLLKALEYLHSPTHGTPPRGYVHSDIKPANIMLRNNNDICLIDFNISLALGEENVIGISPGYASPEHYGLDYSDSGSTRTIAKDTVLVDENGKTVMTARATGTSRRTIVPDVRSDIYSLGATLYHLFSGRRPAKDVSSVVPLTAQDVSPQIAAIISKSMRANPDERYQSAAEMLWDFEHLHENDPRTKRLKRQRLTAAIVLTGVLLLGTAMTFTGLRQMRAKAEKAAEAERLEKEKEENAKEAHEEIVQAQDALTAGDVAAATTLSLAALERNTQYNAEAQAALSDALGVYDLSDGFKAHLSVELPSEPLKALLSPRGTRIATIYAWNVAVFDTESGEKLVEMPVESSALSDVAFLDENRIVFAGDGGLCACDLQGDVLWRGKAATGIALSADGSRIAAVYKDEGVCRIYDASTGTLQTTVDFGGRYQRVAANTSFADPKDNLLALSADGAWLAVSFDGGGLYLYDLRHEGDMVEVFDRSEYYHFEGGFYQDTFAFSADSGSKSVFSLIDLSSVGAMGSMSASTPFRLQADETGIYLANQNVVVQIDPETFDERELAYTEKDITFFRHGELYTVTVDEEGAMAIFDRAANLLGHAEYDGGCDFAGYAGDFAFSASRNTPALRLQKRTDHKDAELLSYDPAYEHIEARLSEDGKTVMLFGINGFRVYAVGGELLADVEIPNVRELYDQQYRRDGTAAYLEVTYNDGSILKYSAQDGALLEEMSGEKPDLSLDEEFFTDKLRITAPLHDTPKAYDRESGELIQELEKDAYLAYVEQVGSYIVTFYMDAQGERYSLLLDDNCKTLARLPYLSDVVNGQLVFDYPSGNLRISRIYSTQELIALAKNQ